MATKEQIQEVAKHYLIAAIWSEAPAGTNPRATKEAQKEAFCQCERFIADCGPLFDEAMENKDYGWYNGHRNAEAQFGQDFWLTRNGHGVGYWDSEALKKNSLDKKLTEICRKFGQAQYEFYRGWFYLHKEWDK